ncbi:MAG: glycosyltransferase family 2 protein [Planctomycetota bacterium]
MDARPKLDLVIVNWNAGALLRECLASVAVALDGSFELDRVVVVDNASTDDSLEGLHELGLPLSVIKNDANRGFGAACNQGASGSRADYVLFLNPDTRLHPESLSVPVGFLEREDNAEVAVCGVQLVDEEGRVARSCARFPRVGTFFWIATGLDRLLPRRRLGYRMSEWDHRESRDVDHVMGAFYLIRRDVFERLEGFDEDYFVYFEDVDLSRRVAALGLRSRFVAEATAYHLGGGTSRKVKARRLAYFLAGKLLYARKHHAGWRAVVAAAATYFVEPLFRCAGALAARSPAGFAETVRAYGLLLRGGRADLGTPGDGRA